MKMSRRARRMQRHHERTHTRASLHLVSLMDIFTILVFFLLIHAGNAEVLSIATSIALPESTAETPLRTTTVITVGTADIMLDGRKVASIAATDAASGDVIAALADELTALHAPTNEVTILGDKHIPYRVLKKIMVTCVRSGYERIALAVLEKTTAPSGIAAQ